MNACSRVLYGIACRPCRMKDGSGGSGGGMEYTDDAVEVVVLVAVVVVAVVAPSLVLDCVSCVDCESCGSWTLLSEESSVVCERLSLGRDAISLADILGDILAVTDGVGVGVEGFRETSEMYRHLAGVSRLSTRSISATPSEVMDAGESEHPCGSKCATMSAVVLCGVMGALVTCISAATA